MKILSYIRLVSYAVCIAATMVASYQPKPLSVFLWGYNAIDAARDRERADEDADRIPKREGFKETRMSGRQVVAAAIAAATKSGGELKGYGEPQIMLLRDGGRLKWVVSFYQIGGPPGAFFDVSVDDQTGATAISPGM